MYNQKMKKNLNNSRKMKKFLKPIATTLTTFLVVFIALGGVTMKKVDASSNSTSIISGGTGFDSNMMSGSSFSNSMVSDAGFESYNSILNGFVGGTGQTNSSNLSSVSNSNSSNQGSSSYSSYTSTNSSVETNVSSYNDTSINNNASNNTSGSTSNNTSTSLNNEVDTSSQTSGEFNNQYQSSANQSSNKRFNVDYNANAQYGKRVAINIGNYTFYTSPIVIHYDRDNLNNRLTENLDQEFDLDYDGKIDKIAFVTKGSGFLAIDKNNDGIINDGRELFGPATNDGFKELAEYDENNDGIINSNDKIYHKLVLWIKDANNYDKLIDLVSLKISAIMIKDASYLPDDQLGIFNSVGLKTGYVLSKSKAVTNEGKEIIVEDLMLLRGQNKF